MDRLFLVLLTFILLLGIIPPNHTQDNIHTPLMFPPAKGNITLANRYCPTGVNIYAIYSHEPAPMGIADYGIGPNGPFIRETTQFLGKVYLDSLNAHSSLNNNCVGFQLNVVLNYEYGGSTYALWVQDVASFNTSSHVIIFIDNIWNLTSYNANVTCVNGNGKIYVHKFYADVAYGYPGSPEVLNLPTSFCMLVNVSTNCKGQPVIYFWYNDGYGWVNYDTVTVENVHNAKDVYFLIDGYRYTGSGNFYDAELDVTGPGGGSCAYILSSNVGLSLEYWNGHNFQEVRNAYNFGSDTAETSNNVIASAYYFIFGGTLISELKTGQGSLGNLWDQNSVSTLTINTNINCGHLLVYNSSYAYSSYYYSFSIPFYGGKAVLTLVPMCYAILVYNNQSRLMGEAHYHTYYGCSSIGVTQFSTIPSLNCVKVSQGSSTTVGITVDAYGSVNISISAPPCISYNIQSPIFVKGSTVDYLTLSVSPNAQPGEYTVTVNASLFPGFYKVSYITVIIGKPLYPVSFSYSVVGNPLPVLPQVTLYFPNGTSETLSMVSPMALKLPVGTTYDIQSTIYSGTNIRWTTDNLTSGTVNSAESINIVYYEQVLVTFELDVQGGQGYGEPEITYYYFGHETTTPPGTVWVDYSSPYSYPELLSGSNCHERWISYSYTGMVTSPTTIDVYYYNQYYVNVVSQIPVYALINGKNITLSSGWYDQGCNITVENITYYTSQGERYIIVSISPSESFTVDSPINLDIITAEQFYLNVNSPIPLYAIIDGTNTTLTTGWYSTGIKIDVENITFYPIQGERYVITQILPSSLVLNGPSTISVSVLLQFYIHVNSTISVYALINGTNTTLTSEWYNAGTSITVENITYYLSQGERYVITSIYPQSFTLKSPTEVNVKVIKQFYVNVVSQIPVYALINGKNITLETGWYNASSSIIIENITYYTSQGERYIITQISPSTFMLTSPSTVIIKALQQFYVNVSSVIPMYALINGSNTTLMSGWYNAETTIKVENITYYPSQGERYVIISISSPSLLVKSPTTVRVFTILQYFVKVDSPIPVKAYINGSLLSINSSWINKGTKIVVKNCTYYVSSDERCVVVNVTPQVTTLAKPITINVETQKQYLVTINGISVWYNKGSTLILNASIPFYEVGKFKGTYNVPVGSVIVVNQPIQETLVETPNYIVLGSITAAVVVIVAASILIMLKRRK
ncbi:thermopsin [Acidianus sp. HS-5]|uniref:thermopsin n=1 Tax=Acidianus sp. HS-5 TaxID=2886040 RepID=UPI001F480410|nr:thermopsin [Acidianus sp. HS-5]BDC18795.1 thermopsin [Acidianus sp. HS-5]